MSPRFLAILPVYNEVDHVADVLDQVCRYSPEVLVVDDGSTDGTAEVLDRRPDVRVLRHAENRGYGAALISAFDFACRGDYDVAVTIDCDGQHEPQRIDRFVRACRSVDIVSGSRYLRRFPGDSQPPDQRRRINRQVTDRLNDLLGLRLTDAFCGFKAYRTSALASLRLTEPGYGMPLELWVQAARRRLSIVELAVPLIYLDESRSFGGALDDGNARRQYYQRVIDHAWQGDPIETTDAARPPRDTDNCEKVVG